MRFSSISMPGNGVLSEPVAMMIAPASTSCAAPSALATTTRPGAAMRPVPFSQSILFLRNRKSTPRVRVVDDLVLALHHRGEIEPDLADLDPVLGERVLAPRRISPTIAAAPSTECSRY